MKNIIGMDISYSNDYTDGVITKSDKEYITKESTYDFLEKVILAAKKKGYRLIDVNLTFDGRAKNNGKKDMKFVNIEDLIWYKYDYLEDYDEEFLKKVFEE